MSWAMVLLAFVGNVLIIRKKAGGFLLWGFADSYFFLRNLYGGDYPQAAIYGLYIMMAIYGLYEWGYNEEDV